MGKKWNIVTIVLFLLVLSLPLLFSNWQEGKTIPMENRAAARRPLFSNFNSVNQEYLAALEAYINDSMGFKNEMIAADLVIKHNVFQTFDIPNYFLGRENHVYYSYQDLGIKTFQGIDHYTQEEMASFLPWLKNADAYYTAQGSRFYLMLIPDKEAIYPEYYPLYILQKDKRTCMDIWTEYIQQHSSLRAFNVRKDLEKAKSEYELLYYRNYDPTHWNMNGAFVGYQSLMRELQKDDPQLLMVQREDMTVTETPSPNGLGYLSWSPVLCAAFSDLQDTIYTYDFKEPFQGVDYGEQVRKEIGWPEGVAFHYYVNEHSLNDKKVLIVGDSYIYSFMLPLLSQTFREVIFSTHNVGIASLEQLQNLTPGSPDIVIFEGVERIMVMEGYSWFALFPPAA